MNAFQAIFHHYKTIYQTETIGDILERTFVGKLFKLLFVSVLTYFLISLLTLVTIYLLAKAFVMVLTFLFT
jgi:hypothetical protein